MKDGIAYLSKDNSIGVTAVCNSLRLGNLRNIDISLNLKNSVSLHITDSH